MEGRVNVACARCSVDVDGKSDSHGRGGAVLGIWWAGSKWTHVRRV